MDKKVSSESVVKDIRRRTRKKYSLEEKIRIVIDGLRGEDSDLPVFSGQLIKPHSFSQSPLD